MAERKENYYIVSTMTSISTVPRINNQYKNLYSNITFTGGWSIPSPLWTEHLNEYGITNPLLSLVSNNGNIFFADNTGLQNTLRAYLEKETGQSVVVEQVDTISGIPIWQFRFE